MDIGDLYLDFVTNLALSGKIRLCVIGQDPYADNKACGIAFCTKTFTQLFHHSTCGGIVLESLGHADIKRIQEYFSTPASFFFYLAAYYGIAFVNLSDKAGILQYHHEGLYDANNLSIIKNNLSKTEDIITNARNSVLLGKSFAHLARQALNGYPLDAITHPSRKASRSPDYQKYWSNGTRYLENKYLSASY